MAGLVSAFLEIYENDIYVVDLVWFLNLKEENLKDVQSMVLDDEIDEIEFKNVWFKYPRNKKWVLKDVSLHIRNKEKIALVGENGAGKSTLIKLLGGFYKTRKGEIFINGTNINELDLNIWRHKMAVLFQQFETYPFASHESIGYGDIERLDEIEDIKDSAKKTGVHDYIEELPLKYENPLAPEFEKGVNPSLGQWQTIGISRMLFKRHAKILVPAGQ